MGPADRLLVGFDPDPDHQGVAHNAAAHIAAHHEAQASEHSYFRHVVLLAQRMAYSQGQVFIEGHSVAPETDRSYRCGNCANGGCCNKSEAPFLPAGVPYGLIMAEAPKWGKPAA